MKSWFRRNGWLVAIAAAYLYVFPYFPKIHSANELPRLYLVKAIVDDHSFAIDRGVARWGSTADVSPSRGHLYSNKAPGSSLLVAPVYAAVELIAGEPGLGATMWLCRVVAGVIPALLLLWLLHGFLARFAPEPEVRRLVLIAYALGSMAMAYSILYISHQLAAVCVASAWILALDVADRRRGLRAMAAAGVLAGCGPLVEYQAAFALVPIAAHVIAKLRRWPRRELARALGIAAAGAAIPIAVLLAYHTACFGSPLRTGYDASTTFAGYHQQGLLGITELRWAAFYGSTFAPDNGLFTLAPWWLLAIPGAVVVWRRGHRDVVIAGAAIAVVFVLFVSSINFWRGGWSLGPRYITVMLPFLLPFVAAVMSAWRTAWPRFGLAAALIVVGVVIYSLAAATFPHWPDSFRHPVYEVMFRMLGDDLAAPNAGAVVGLSGVAGLVPYLAVVGGLVGWAIQRAGGWRAVAVAAAAGTAILIAYRMFDRTPNADALYARGVVPAVVAR